MSKMSAATKASPAKGAGRPRAAEVEARLHDLKRTAGRLFLEKGYGNVSLEMIAREARVAVRTIYIKFGGKNGLLSAMLQDKRAQFFADMDLAKDPRPVREVLDDFAARLYSLLTSPEAVALQRMLAAEARSNPQMVDTFYAMGPNVTRDAIACFLQRPDVRAQLRDDLPVDQLPVHLINCVLGDQLSRVLRGQQEGTPEQCAAARRQRMELFYRSVLR
ncbi:MAG: TetR/AcrR family transcriptional regulator [Rubrivivax sp.]|nr:MAG: TetR/AcrR family transcriptional regulator [Rubrivivax sp.]